MDGGINVVRTILEAQIDADMGRLDQLHTIIANSSDAEELASARRDISAMRNNLVGLIAEIYSDGSTVVVATDNEMVA